MGLMAAAVFGPDAGDGRLAAAAPAIAATRLHALAASNSAA
jgi:hypothetical protein